MTLPPDYFDALYEVNPDPWNFATRDYEIQKYAATLENLPRPHYHRALELGCSIGVLSELLSARVDALLSLDAAPKALKSAKNRCLQLSNIAFQRAVLPDEFPSGEFDLVVMSEIGYYFSPSDLARLALKIAGALPRRGDLILVHYLPKVPDYPSSGDAVHEHFLKRAEWEFLNGFRAERYRLDCLRRV